jgi:hypothetical protein
MNGKCHKSLLWPIVKTECGRVKSHVRVLKERADMTKKIMIFLFYLALLILMLKAIKLYIRPLLS